MAIYVLNAMAEPLMLNHVNKISWMNPLDLTFDHVAVYRRADQFQTDPSSPYGVLIYSGTGTTIYDYWATAGDVPTTQKSYPQIANTDLTQTISDGLYHTASNVLIGGQVYYYTIFCYDKSGNWFCSLATMVTSAPMDSNLWGNRLWDMLPEIYQKSDGGQTFDPSPLKRGQLQRLLALLAYAFEWTDNRAKRTPLLLNVFKTDPDKLDYIADFLGWTLDKTQPLSTQRNALANAINIYHLAGTRKGLDVLVKYYSGFPTTSGVIENSIRTLTAPLFSNNQVYFTSNVGPDFGTWDTSTMTTTFTTQSMDFSQIGKVNDPLYYCYDFSSSAKTGASQFTAYVQPTYTLTNQQQTDLINKLTTVLNSFVPAGVGFSIQIYS